MPTEYVVENAILSCTCGAQTVGLLITTDRHITSEHRLVANKSDMCAENIQSFGICSALQIDCIREDISLTPWLDCKDDVIVAGHPAVLTSSKLMCSKGGGTISVDGSGQ